MINIERMSDDNKTIYYWSDIKCNCKIQIFQKDKILFASEMILEPNIQYYTSWFTNWYDKEVIFETDTNKQKFTILGNNKFFNLEKNSNFVQEVNLIEETELCEIMSEFGSDKSSKKINLNLPGHNYTKFYSQIFENIRRKNMNIFELGLGTNNPNLESNMTESGKPGASLYGWKKYFNNSKIYGADIDTDILFDDLDIKTFYCDQTNPKIIKQLWNQKDLDFDFDIIIEDGLHSFEANKTFLESSLHKIKSGGFYIIEDVIIDELPRWCQYFEFFEKNFFGFEIKFIKLNYSQNNYDNNLILIKRV